MKERKYALFGIITTIILIIGTTLAYFKFQVFGNKKVINVESTNLQIIFNNGDSTFEGNALEPGNYDEIKTFSVKNETDTEFKYNIIIKDLINTFVTKGYLVYKITNTSNNGGYSMSDFEDIPKSSIALDIGLAYNITIPSGVTQDYTIEIKYLNDPSYDQSDDMEKEVSGSIYIAKGTEPTFITKILEQNKTISERTNFKVTNTDKTTGTIYKTNKTEDSSDVYYYSGNTIDNWVKFGKYTTTKEVFLGYANDKKGSAKEYSSYDDCINATSYYHYCEKKIIWKSGDDMYWRIIRTNEDGSVRLLYSGTSPDTTEGYIGTSTFNNSTKDPLYVGYMYGTSGSLENNRTNENDSSIKQFIDTWYQNNLLNNYDKYISKDAIYCHDRSINDNKYSLTENFTFATYTRLAENFMPNYKCGTDENGNLFESTQAVADKFSASTTGGGNGQLKYPVVLMTADEVSFAGGAFKKTAVGAWHYSNKEPGVLNSITDTLFWWLFSPSEYGSKVPNVFSSDGSISKGYLNRLNALNSYVAVRPVISVSSCARVKSGNGTADNPYVVDEEASTC